MLSLLTRRMASTSAGVLSQFSPSIPPLNFDKYKGQDGKVCVVGGSLEYTGAPYFAAISALLAGADLSHVICPREAAPVIKSYSPELIVHPLLHSSDADEIRRWLPRFHAVVVGPGLGRSDEAGRVAGLIISECARLGRPLVIDADGVFLVTQRPELLEGNPRVVLTPNRVEFQRLYSSVFDGQEPTDDVLEVEKLAARLGNVTCVRKGPQDVISDGQQTVVCGHPGGPRRCGGQGDVLAGTAALFVHWAQQPIAEPRLRESVTLEASILGAFAACSLTRHCSRLAFESKGRATTTSDLIANVGTAFRQLFEK